MAVDSYIDQRGSNDAAQCRRYWKHRLLKIAQRTFMDFTSDLHADHQPVPLQDAADTLASISHGKAEPSNRKASRRTTQF